MYYTSRCSLNKFIYLIINIIIIIRELFVIKTGTETERTIRNKFI